jgi:hypothetical protein
MQMKLSGVTNVDFSVVDQQWIKFSCRYLRKSGNIMVQYISYLYVSRKPKIQLRGKYCTVFSLSLEYPRN